MKQRYCPYCDQKMTSGLYCSGCKRIVWHPYVQDVDYYLNERHPRHESDCLYHDGGSEYPGSSTSGTDSYAGIFKGNGTSTRIQGGKKKTNREKKTADPFQNMGNRMTGQRNAFEHMKSQLEQYRSQADTCQSGTYSSQSAKNIMDRVNSERGRKKPFTGILIVVIIWLVFSVGGNLLFLITHAIRERSTGSRTSSTRPAAISGPLPIPMPWRSLGRASSPTRRCGPSEQTVQTTVTMTPSLRM